MLNLKRVLENNDIINIVKYLAGLKDGFGHIDDIDHLEIEELDLWVNYWKINILLVLLEWKGL